MFHIGTDSFVPRRKSTCTSINTQINRFDSTTTLPDRKGKSDNLTLKK